LKITIDIDKKMLTKDQKKEIVRSLREKIKQSKSIVVCDYKGTNVSNFSLLRNELTEDDMAEIKVAKKTLLDLALKEEGIELETKKLDGQIALVFSKKDEAFAPKKIFDFSKKVKTVNILAGALGEKAITKKEVEDLAKLPAKDELLTKVVGTINAPITNFVGVLSGNLRNLVYVLNAIKSKKESV